MPCKNFINLLLAFFFLFSFSNSFSEQNNSADFNLLKIERRPVLSDVGRQLSELLSQKENLTEVEKEKQKELREIEDLTAQKEMAKWASPMFFLTLISVAISIFGVIGLVLTLKTNTKALNISAEGFKLSKKTLQAQLRPYIQVTLSNSFKTVLTDGNKASIAVKFDNVGHTPAINMKHSMNVGFYSHEAAESYISNIDLSEVRSEIIFPQGGKANIRFLNADNSPLISYWIEGVRLKKVKIIVDSMAVYDDEFGASHCTSARWEVFMPHDEVMVAELSKEGNFAS